MSLNGSAFQSLFSLEPLQKKAHIIKTVQKDLKNLILALQSSPMLLFHWNYTQNPVKTQTEETHSRMGKIPANETEFCNTGRQQFLQGRMKDSHFVNSPYINFTIEEHKASLWLDSYATVLCHSVQRLSVQEDKR